MQHSLPTTPAFRDALVTDPIQEIALRVVVELPNWEFHVLGTAVLIASNLAVTANHVLQAAIKNFGRRETSSSIEVEHFSLTLYQVLPGPVYRVWNVVQAWGCPTDIAILHMRLDRTSETERSLEVKVPGLRLTPPPSGQVVIAFGYRESRIEVTKGSNDTHHIEFNDLGTISIGRVGQVFTERRDSSMLTFPCFEVLARFVPGMSGGLVIDEEGALCGLVCAGTDMADTEALPLSYAATLWPMLRTLISADRGSDHPRGVEYPAIDLALAHLIHTIGLEDLDPIFFPGRVLPRRHLI